MGCGVALQAKRKFPTLPKLLAEHLEQSGNCPAYFPELNLATIPTKDDYRADSSLARIVRTCVDLDSVLEAAHIDVLVIPHVGCGAGNLSWPDVRAVLENIVVRTKLIIVKPL